MSGIIALFHLDGRPAEAATLNRLIAPISHRAVDDLKIGVWGSSGLVQLDLQSTPAASNEMQPSGSMPEMAISFDGRLDNREELICKLPGFSAQELQGLSDGAFAFAAYREFGEIFAKHLKGDFAIAILDGKQQKLLLARDIMGIRPLYHCQIQKTFLAASEIKSILAYPGFRTRPDDDALADLLLAGDPYERERTCFSGVSRVLPGHTIVVTPETVRSFRHCDFDTLKQQRCASFEDYVERLRALFEQAVRRRLRSSHPVAVMVSGGLDSSAILCQAELLRKAGTGVAPCIGIAMTFPEGTDADEKQFLSDIEDCYKISIRKLMFSRLRFVEREKSIWNSELPQLDWDARSEILRTASQMGCRIVLDGYYGDQMLANAGYFVDLARKFRWLQLKREFAEYGRWMADVDPASIGKHIRRILLRGLMPHRFVRTVRKYRGIPKSRHPVWYSEEFRERASQRYFRSRRITQRCASYHTSEFYDLLACRPRINVVESDNKTCVHYGMEKAYPFMDVDLIRFLMAIPGDIINWKGVPKGLFRRAMSGILPETIRQRKWKADFTALNNDAVESNYSEFQGYWQRDCRASTAGYADHTLLASQMGSARFDRNNRTPAAQVLDIEALELWLRVFWR